MTDETDRLIHNIRNPLNAISVNAELGKLCLEGGVDMARLEQALDSIVRQCAACAEQVERLQEHLQGGREG